jgi:apolipoprotein N-acyltransferase
VQGPANKDTRLPWYRSTLAVALIGTLLMWAAQPPLALGWLAWIAPVPWLILVRRSELHGRRPYAALWLAGFVFWLLAIHWIRLPHPALHLGWIALSGYLALYIPVFIALSRIGIHRLGAPLWLAAPVVWTGLELARAHVLTGFLMGSLAHTQVNRTMLIQISDLFGQYGVDFIIMMVAASVACVLVQPRKWFALAPAGILLGSALAYGTARLESATTAPSSVRSARIALIQGNSLPEWKYDPSRERQIMDEYISQSEKAVVAAEQEGKPVDLVVWPETMFRTPLVTIDEGFKPPPGATRTPEEIAAHGYNDLRSLVHRLNAPVLVGVERLHFPANDASSNEAVRPLRYNSAALSDLMLIGTYDKVHRVAFGEFIPFAKWMPWLYTLTPLTGGIEAGEGPVVLEHDGKFYAPNICYETVVPHVIRAQANTRRRRHRPDVLVNLTNDAWYRGSSELDMHLACGMFRAVETRTPLVIAANGGISAWIDQHGRIRQRSPKQQPHFIIADVESYDQGSLYLFWGDWFAGTCLLCCVGLGLVGWRSARHDKKFGVAADANTGPLTPDT